MCTTDQRHAHYKEVELHEQKRLFWLHEMALDLMVSSRLRYGLRQLISKGVTARHHRNNYRDNGKRYLDFEGSEAAPVPARAVATPRTITASNQSYRGPCSWLSHHPARSYHRMISGAVTFKTTEVLDDDVRVDWSDGSTSHFNFIWLRVNCPSIFHAIGQRTLFPGDVDPMLRPSQVNAYSSKV